MSVLLLCLFPPLSLSSLVLGGRLTRQLIYWSNGAQAFSAHTLFAAIAMMTAARVSGLRQHLPQHVQYSSHIVTRGRGEHCLHCSSTSVCRDQQAQL